MMSTNGMPGGRHVALWLVLSCLVPACTKHGADAKSVAQSAGEVAAGDTREMDTRRAVAVDAATRLAVLAEMRAMLKAVQGIVGAAAIDDTASMRAAALTAGTGAASEGNPGVRAQLGEEFVQLGMRTHMAFDSLAEAIAERQHSTVVLRRLANVMGNCVGCHEQWRLTVR